MNCGAKLEQHALRVPAVVTVRLAAQDGLQLLPRHAKPSKRRLVYPDGRVLSLAPLNVDVEGLRGRTFQASNSPPPALAGVLVVVGVESVFAMYVHVCDTCLRRVYS